MSSLADIEAALDRALELGEVGIQVAAYSGEEQVLSLCAGTVASRGDADPVTPSTLFPVFSVTKAVTATALHLQAARGLIDITRPVATYWPEFAEAGKDGITVREVLTHRSRMAAMPADVTVERLADWDWMVSALAKMPPEIDSYHAISWGWLVGELVRRTDVEGRSYGQFVEDELFGPLKVDDFHIGLDDKDFSRVAELTSDLPDSDDPARLALVPRNVALTPQVYNSAPMRRAVNPSSGGIASAEAVARFFAFLANSGELDGIRILPDGYLESCTEPRPDPYRPEPAGMVRWIGAGGYWLGGVPPAEPVFGHGLRVLGHPGAGGSFGWADLEARLAVAITHNRMFPFEGLERERHPFIVLADAVRSYVTA